MVGAAWCECHGTPMASTCVLGCAKMIFLCDHHNSHRCPPPRVAARGRPSPTRARAPPAGGVSEYLLLPSLGVSLVRRPGWPLGPGQSFAIFFSIEFLRNLGGPARKNERGILSRNLRVSFRVEGSETKLWARPSSFAALAHSLLCILSAIMCILSHLPRCWSGWHSDAGEG